MGCVLYVQLIAEILPVMHRATILRVAKFESKVGSRRTTKIGNLVVLDIFLVALILIPYNMRFVLSSQNDMFVGKGKGEIKTSKNLCGQLYFPKNIW